MFYNKPITIHAVPFGGNILTSPTSSNDALMLINQKSKTIVFSNNLLSEHPPPPHFHNINPPLSVLAWTFIVGLGHVSCGLETDDTHQGSLEAGVVVRGNLVLDIVCPAVLVVVLGVRSSDQRPLQDLGTGDVSAELGLTTGTGSVWARRRPVVRLFGVLAAVTCPNQTKKKHY